MSQFNGVLLAARSPMVARVPASLVDRLQEILPLTVLEIADEETEFDYSHVLDGGHRRGA